MTRKLGWIFVVVAFSLAGCGDDKGGKLDGVKVKLDKGTPKTDGPITPVTDGPVTKLDKTVTPTDGAAAPCPTPFKAKVNSGKTCTAAGNECSADEICMAFSSTATKGMCLGLCCANPANPQDPANICPVVDAKKQLSACEAIVTQGGKPNGQMACLWACSVTQGTQTATFDCPDATNYDCKVLFPNQPDVKYCAPK